MDRGTAVRIVVDKPNGISRITRDMFGVIYFIDGCFADIIHIDETSYWYRFNCFYQYSAAEEALLPEDTRGHLNHIRREYGL